MVTKSSEYYVYVIAGELLPIENQYGPFPLWSIAQNVARTIANDYRLLGIPYKVTIGGHAYRERFVVNLDEDLVLKSLKILKRQLTKSISAYFRREIA